MSISHVLYITYDGLLEPLGASQVIPYVLGLARRGYSIEVLSFEKPHDAEQARALADKLAEAGVAWCPLTYHRRPPIVSKAYDILAAAAFVVARSRKRPVLIHARSYLPALMGLPAKLWGSRLLLDTRGLWIDERVEKGHWNENSLLVRTARAVERQIMAAADHFVHLTSRTQDALSLILPGVRLAPFQVIPTCADLERFSPPKNRPELRRRLGLPEQAPILLHSGTLSGWYLGELTFAVGAAFVKQTGGVFLVLTQETQLAQQLAEKLCPETIIASATPDQVHTWVQACDAGLALVRPSFAKTASCPTKVGEYLGVGLAVAATAGVGDLAEQFAGNRVAFAVQADDPPESIAASLVTAIDEPDRIPEARRLGEQFWSLEKAVDNYSAVYQALGVAPNSGSVPG